MSRQTAFPGIFVDELEIEKPPFDEEGVVQEFVGRAMFKEFEVLQRAEDFTPDQVQDFMESVEDEIGPLRDEFKVKYHLKVRAFPTTDVTDIGLASNLQQRSVSTRARIFARAKNPFEPDVIDISTPREDPDLSGGEVGDVYSVTATVTK